MTRMMALTAVTALMAAPPLAELPDWHPQAQPGTATVALQDFEWSGRIAAGQAIEIKGVNGSIYASAASGDQVEVRAEKHGRGEHSSVTFEVIEHSDGVTICAVYPTPDDDRPNECAPGDDGRMNTRDSKVSVEWTIEVPAGVRFIGKTVNGSIDARGLGAAAEASTVNGDIDLATSGWAEASTVNGSIDVEMGRSDWDGTASFRTVNGSIDITLPDEVNTRVEASTVNGDFQSDFPLTVRGRFGPRSVQGVIGDGGRELELNTVNGAIRLRQS